MQTTITTHSLKSAVTIDRKKKHATCYAEHRKKTEHIDWRNATS